MFMIEPQRCTGLASNCMRVAAAIVKAADAGESVNEVEAAGNTPLHHAAYEGWVQGAELLLSLGAHINASNNAGDRPWHWARNMGYDDAMEMLEQVCRAQRVYNSIILHHYI